MTTTTIRSIKRYATERGARKAADRAYKALPNAAVCVTRCIQGYAITLSSEQILTDAYVLANAMPGFQWITLITTTSIK